MAAVAKREGGVESSLRSKHKILREYLVVVLVSTLYSSALLTLHKKWMGLG